MRRTIRPEQIEVVDDAIAAILRRKSSAERLNMAFAANRTARMLIASAIREQNPLWTDNAIAREVARRMLGTA